MVKPDIGLIFVEGLPEEVFTQFKADVDADGVNVIVESKEPHGPMACPEWFILTAVAAFVAKSYFDGFLKEMGKDHYNILKNSLSDTTKKVMKTPRIEPTLFGSEGKLSSNNPFSLAFSIYAEAENGYIFKLLVPKNTHDLDYGLIVSKFLDFLTDYHLGLQTLESVGCAWIGPRPPGNMIFVHYNQETDAIEWLNALDYR
ncbi:hypothetical protein QNZ80_003148 [Vibrio parahaemolyticus]|nr:hypothetical protein [Vibrio parahaemolyticus]ELB2167945.1 hypothetical protein [Vibrio parahaemolyticus]ELB2188234.1 hypothetical protein [Vibrio parahaemolyticus]ELB2193484.1 hypothetical protein [Vibrio parahaemolyticus]ELB2213646.1 hypothetical protein [Vibrio parahaemolyticus]